jgi:TolB protein
MKIITRLFLLLLLSAPGIFAQLSGELKIAYNVLDNPEEGDYEIYVMDLNGNNKKNISNSKGTDWVYLGFRDKLYFVSDRDTVHGKYFLYEMDAEGNNIKRITNFNVDDSWLGVRYEGLELIVSSSYEGRRAFYIIDASSGEIHSKVTPPLAYINDPIFSPDGGIVIFRGCRDDYDKYRKDFDELYTMSPDGSALDKLTKYPANDTTASWREYHAGPPFWIPGTEKISFTSYREGNYDIYSVNLDGTGLKKLTSGKNDEGWHSWSPDGEMVVFDGTDRNVNYDIYIMDANGENVNKLTNEKKVEQAPVFVRTK